MTRPSGPRVGVGHRVISTTTMSPGFASRCSSGGILHVHDQPAVERHDEAEAGVVDVEAADDRRDAALQDAQDAPLGAVVA